MLLSATVFFTSVLAQKAIAPHAAGAIALFEREDTMSGNASNGSTSGMSSLTTTTITPIHPALPGARQFDFWIGEWNLSWAEGGKGRNSIQAVLEGQVILESFEAQQSPTFQGMSVSVYNDALGKW